MKFLKSVGQKLVGMRVPLAAFCTLVVMALLPVPTAHSACNSPSGDAVLLTYTISPNRSVFAINEVATMTLVVDGVPTTTETIDTSAASSAINDQSKIMTYTPVSEDSPGDCSVKLDYTVINVEIKAADGVTAPDKVIPVSKQSQYKCVVTPALSGTYSWSSGSANLTLVDTSSQTLTVNAGATPSTTVDAETLQLTYTPSGGPACDPLTHSLSVVKVNSIQPDSMPNVIQELPNLSDPSTRIFVVPVMLPGEDPVVTVRATLAPSMAEIQVPSCCSLQGGVGSDRLTRTVRRDAGPSKTVFTFTCNGVDMGLKTIVYVYKAKLGLYADKGSFSSASVGHSWGEYSLDETAKLDLIPQALRSYLTFIGFFPSVSGFPGDTGCTGDVRKGPTAYGSHTATGSCSYRINIKDLSVALDLVDTTFYQPPDYDIYFYNCTNYAIWLGEIVYVPTYSYFGTLTPWGFSAWLNANGSQFN